MKRSLALGLLGMSLGLPAAAAAKDLSPTFLSGTFRRNTPNGPQWLYITCTWLSDPAKGFQTSEPRDDRTWCESTLTSLLKFPSGAVPVSAHQTPWEPF